MINPYASPESDEPVVIQREGYRPWLAILLGVAVDIGGTIVMSVVVSIALGGYLIAVSGVAPDNIGQLILTMFTNGPLFWGMTLLGLLISLLAGYLTARMVKRHELRCGTIQAAVSTLLGLTIGSAPLGAAILTVMAALSFAAVLAGAALGKRRNQAAQSAVVIPE